MTNELKIFNSDVIPVYETDTGNKVVIGRVSDRGCSI